MKFIDYKKHFTGKKLKIYPGEHHFVSLCLIPWLLEVISTEDQGKISFINPDGSKSMSDKTVLICDLTFDGIGVEVKYSENSNLEFTKVQYKDFKDSNNFQGLWGFLAIINVAREGKAELVGISREKFFEKYGDLKEGSGRGMKPVDASSWEPISQDFFLKTILNVKSNSKIAA
jgi:hypothetical protein